MQNKIKGFLVCMFIIAVFPALIGCNHSQQVNETSKDYIDNSRGEEVDSNADLSFIVMGDVHNNIDNFKEAVDDFYKINPNIDALILNGDTVDQGTDEQYESMEKAIDKNLSRLPETIIKNIGNHEFYNYDIDTNSKEDIDNFTNKYLKFSGTENVYHDTWIKEYHFISLGSDELNSEDLNTTQASLSETQLLWLEEKLKENYKQGKPIFVFLHQPISTDFFGREWYGVRQGDKLKQILSKYPEVIIFSSHTHKEFGYDSIQENMPYTMRYTGAVGYTLVKDENSDNGRKRDNSYNNALYVEVNDNAVTFKQRDVENHKWYTLNNNI